MCSVGRWGGALGLALVVLPGLGVLLTGPVGTGVPGPSDVVVFLAGGGGERAAYAHALATQGLAPRILSTRVDPTCGGDRQPERPCTSEVRNTLDEALLMARILPAEGVRTATIVTSRYHARRAAAIFAIVFLGRGIAVHVVAPPGPAPTGLLASEERWKLVPSAAAAVVARVAPSLYAVLRPVPGPRLDPASGALLDYR